MAGKQRKIIWWWRILWLIGLIILWWMVFHQPVSEPPSLEEQILESTALTDQPAVGQLVQSLPEGIVIEPSKSAVESEAIVEPAQNINQQILLEVPFTCQAPDAHWADDHFQDGCEEAVVLMAMAWVRGESLDKIKAKQAILDLSAWQEENYGNYYDTSASDTAERLIKGYYKYDNFEVEYDISIADIKEELAQGYLVLVPTNGQWLNNPHFTQPGPVTHMVVIRGYDPDSQEFITNDPGTKYGQGYRYNVSVLLAAIRDYPTGRHEPILETKTAMIVVKPE